MGGTSSLATIYVAFEGNTNHHYSPGDTVQGKVYLSVERDEVTCTSVGARVLGQEKTKTHTGGGKNRHTFIAAGASS